MLELQYPNETWQGHELYEPASAEALARFIDRTPAYSFDNLLVLEDLERNTQHGFVTLFVAIS